jgi:hypothetical protein
MRRHWLRGDGCGGVPCEHSARVLAVMAGGVRSMWQCGVLACQYTAACCEERFNVNHL